MAVCCEIHTKHINTVCGQNVELLNVKLVVNIVTTGLCWVSSYQNQPHAPSSVFPDYDGAGKALSAMCEIASEACSAWFPQSDN
jgi:hypothetical protein